MGGLCCCCYRDPNPNLKTEEPSYLVSKDGSPAQSPRKSYGAIPTEDPSPRKTSVPSSPRKSPSELLYSEPPQSARVRSPSPRTLSPMSVSPGRSSESISAQEESGWLGQKRKKTLAEIASLSPNTTSAFQPPSPSKTSQEKESDTKSAGDPRQKMRDPSPLPEVTGRRSASFESDTCHSIGGTTDEEVDEDTRILDSLTPTTASMMSAGSESRLITTTPSPGSSTLDVSKDSMGRKPSKAKDFMKKAGKNMKKAKKKMGKGVEKMLKKKEESDTDRSDISRERTGSNTDEPTAAAGAPPRRVTSERMKSKYARTRLAEMEKKREEEASQRSAQGMVDPRQAAHERGEKLSELEDKSDQMRVQAAAFADNVSQLKSRSGSSS